MLPNSRRTTSERGPKLERDELGRKSLVASRLGPSDSPSSGEPGERAARAASVASKGGVNYRGLQPLGQLFLFATVCNCSHERFFEREHCRFEIPHKRWSICPPFDGCHNVFWVAQADENSDGAG